MSADPIVIIGAGIGGLCAAARLAAAGKEVLVLETRPVAGGKLGLLEEAGFSWDTGPSLFTEPWLFDELFRDCGRNRADYLQYRELDEGTRYFWDDGQRFHADPNRTQLLMSAVETFGPAAKNLAQYLTDVQMLYRNIGPLFLDKSLHRLRDWDLSATLQVLPYVKPAYLFRTLHQYNQSRLKDPRLVQIMDRMATYNGSDPYRCPAMLSMIAQLEFNQGSWYAEGGMISLPRALRRLCEDLGVTFGLGHPVQRLIPGEQCWLVSGQGFRHRASAVISNLDVGKTYRDLLSDKALGEKILAQERSCSGLVFYWGMNRTFPELGLHNIFFSNDYREEFRSIFRDKRISGDPTVYLNITSKQDFTHAPAGGENWFLLVNAPAAPEKLSSDDVERVREIVIAKLERALGHEIGSAIQISRTLTPSGIERATGSVDGALYGNSSNGTMAAFHRHPNYSRKYPGLFFAGGTVHPGGGVPLCLRSGKIAVAAVLEHVQQSPSGSVC